MSETRPISHEDAREIAHRLVKSAWRRDGEVLERGERFVTHIPARPDLDDDIRIFEYIRQREADEDSRLSNTLCRYIAFGFNECQLYGGIDTMVGSADTISELLNKASDDTKYVPPEFVDVIDLFSGAVRRFQRIGGFDVEDDGPWGYKDMIDWMPRGWPPFA